MVMRAVAPLVLLAVPVQAVDNGLGRTPPMGWRSWNAYHSSITQDMMTKVMDKMAERNRTVDGKAMSLADLGFVNCGLDDYWQQCGAGVNKSFHDATGKPLINSKFPDMKAMTDHGHSLGLRVGWYMNNCGCSEHEFQGYDHIKTHMEGSVKALVDYGYDGIKLDGCGQFLNLTWWADLLNKTGRPILIENCHWGGTTPGGVHSGVEEVMVNGEVRSLLGGPSQTDGPCTGTTDISDCPYNFYRTSGDIGGSWDSMFRNLQTTRKFQGNPPLSRPGAWAYPDMMEVGKLSNATEDRSHFGAWCITSSPLVLGYDLMDESITDRVWPIVSNQEAIAVNQAWAGHPGRMVMGINPSSNYTQPYVWGVTCDKGPEQAGWAYDSSKKSITHNGNCMELVNKLIVIKSCDGSTAQQFTMGSDGSIKTSDGECLDVYDFIGPVVQPFRCNGGTNQHFTLSSGVLADKTGQCLAVKSHSPSADSDKIQLWAKPLSSNEMAVLVINNDNSANTVSFDLSQDLGIAGGKASVRDIWNRKDIGSASGLFTTDSIATHDSRFYKLSY